MYGINKVMAKMKCMESDDEREGIDNYNFEELTNQCQRYEEQIVELHSVIAELSRKLEVEQDDIIPEETETSGEDFDESQHDSFNNGDYNEEKSPKSSIFDLNSANKKPQLNKRLEDYNSLVFERDLETQLVEVVDLDQDEKEERSNIENVSNCYSECKNRENADRKQKLEIDHNSEVLDQVKRELEESRKELEQLKELLTLRDGEKEVIILERNSLRRQLDDLQTTMEYQDAKMDLRKKPSSRKSSAISSKVPDDISKATCVTVEDELIHSHLFPLPNSKSTPAMLKQHNENSSIPKQLQRRRSLRKSKKNAPRNYEQVIY